MRSSIEHGEIMNSRASSSIVTQRMKFITLPVLTYRSGRIGQDCKSNNQTVLANTTVPSNPKESIGQLSNWTV